MDSLVRTGIHVTLGIDRAKEEINQLIIKIRRCLTWGVFHRDQLKSCIDQCVLGVFSRMLSFSGTSVTHQFDALQDPWETI